MSKYGRTRVQVQYGAASDFSDADPNKQFSSSLSSPVKELHIECSAAITTGTIVELGTFTAIQAIIIYNQDGTNFVEARLTDRSTANKLKVPLLDWIKICTPDPTVDLVLIADTAACVCEVIVIGT